MSFKKYNTFINEVVGIVNDPVYQDYPTDDWNTFDEGESDKKTYIKEIATILKEIYSTALTCKCDGHKIKETLFPKYKDSKVKLNVTEDGKFKMDSFGRYPDIIVDLNNMKKGNHTKETIVKEIKRNIKKLTERMPGMPSQSAIASFSSAPHLAS